MTDEKTYQIHFDHNLNIHIDSISLDSEVKSQLEYMLNERENEFKHETLPEINHSIRRNGYSFEVKLYTDEGKIEEIVQKHIDTQKELEREAEEYMLNYHDNIAKMLDKELEMLERGELQIDTELTW